MSRQDGDHAQMSVAGRLVLIAGATSASGHAVAGALLEAGARVIAVGSNRERLDAFGEAHPDAVCEHCDLTDESAVIELAIRVHQRAGHIDGLVHLVGGWRGGGGIAGQTDADYRVLERSFTALRHVSRIFAGDLEASPAGRLAIVSSTAVARPLAGSANYVAVKAASEAWTLAVAHGFGRRAADASADDDAAAAPDLRSAAVIFRVRSLAGLENALAASVTALWDVDASAVNGVVETLEA
jgi:3-oxoacyl-[acyl-carrier protein] reductase